MERNEKMKDNAKLTRRQKREIIRLSKSKSNVEIASIMGVNLDVVRKYLNLAVLNNNPQRAGTSVTINLKKWSKENSVFLFSFFLLIIIAYANSIGNRFLSDDIGIIEQNKLLGTNKFIFELPLLFLRPFFYSIIFKIFGRNPVFFRLMNIFFHFGSTCLFYFIISNIATFKKIAFFAAILFCIHPIMVESVTWISGGYYPQYGFFLLLSLSLYLVSKDNKKITKFSWLAYVFALVSAERSIIFPAILFTWEICFGNLKKYWKKILPYCFLSLFWLLAMVTVQLSSRIQAMQTMYYQKRSLANPLVQIPVALSSYFELIFWPKNLTLYQSELNFSKINFVFRVIATFIYFSSLIYTYFKNKPVFFWLSFFIITLSPSLTPLNISWVFAERYAYLGSMGIFVTLTYLFYEAKKYYRSEKIYFSFLILLMIPLTVRTIVRNVDWTDQDHLWLAAEKTSPSSHQNHNNLGDYWARHGDFQKAVEEFQKAIDLLPNYADAYHNMATSYHQLGKDDLALASYQKAIYFNPNLWQSYQNIGAILFTRGDIENAEKFYAKAAEINPNSSMLHTALGIINLKKGNLKEANKEFEIAVNLDPQNQEAKNGFLQTKTN